MRINVVTFYAVQSLVTIASSSYLENSKSISDKTGISSNILEKILMKLRQSNILESSRGPSGAGGYRLKSCDNGISLYSVFLAMDEMKNDFLSEDILENELNALLINYLKNTKIDFVEKN